MALIKVSEVINAVKGRLIAGRSEGVFSGVSIDSRSVRKRDLFIAIVGKRLDGHGFAAEAVRKGAAGVVVSDASCLRGLRGGLGVNAGSSGDRAGSGDVVVVLVEDTTRALQDLAGWHRSRFYCPVAAITGSNGKTTTKELTWAILSRKYRTVRNEGSKNNHIGLPLTLLELDKDTEAAVVELGTSGFGEIRQLASVCLPDVGCITNVGASHLEFFDSVENVARAKAELLEEMREGCPVVLNVDDRWYEWLRGKAKGPVLTFGIQHPADLMAEDIQAGDGSVTFHLLANVLGEGRFVQMAFPGAHNVYNALAAAAVSLLVGGGISEIEEGLAQAKLPSMRYEITNVCGVMVINDAYNANPVSTMCALSSFCEMSVPGRRIFVCGDMLELGQHARRAHREVGRFVAEQGIDYVVAFGELAAEVVEAAFPEDGGGERWACCESVEEVVSVLLDVAEPGDAILVKGSRGNGMERIVDGLKAAQLAGSAGGSGR